MDSGTFVPLIFSSSIVLLEKCCLNNVDTRLLVWLIVSNRFAVFLFIYPLVNQQVINLTVDTVYGVLPFGNKLFCI